MIVVIVLIVGCIDAKNQRLSLSAEDSEKIAMIVHISAILSNYLNYLNYLGFAASVGWE